MVGSIDRTQRESVVAFSPTSIKHTTENAYLSLASRVRHGVQYCLEAVDLPSSRRNACTPHQGYLEEATMPSSV